MEEAMRFVWRERVDYRVVWNADVRTVVEVERVGPLFKVTDGGRRGEYERWDGRTTWHLTYNGARIKFLERVVEAKRID
jgi:hypothetical protein